MCVLTKKLSLSAILGLKSGNLFGNCDLSDHVDSFLHFVNSPNGLRGLLHLSIELTLARLRVAIVSCWLILKFYLFSHECSHVETMI